MNTKTEAKEYRMDPLKWLLVLGLIAVGVVGNSHFSAEPLLYRVLGLLVVAAVAILIALQTEKGAGLWRLLRESMVEVRKVVWPSRQETNQTTLIVIAVVIVMSIILWLLDTFFGWIASLIIG
ncbi:MULTISPECIES: preprotein translocase subunit SecE [Marinimicrobium]|jgi:preprotein translocase subunit SecE|uniref:Protein translocase subunit SecE n=1 Tax=Marinimicrobium koreense TaxID=306545 RepID=A0A3N1NMR2_9GAMM|nr:MULTISPECIES: preprotein translocase subunit SecE [Marinimicrobium]MAN52336.1 preprotein translocase subunit SecE [Marinimicrobium sp.]ROQ17139.1 protein translocase subunit secE/sec61 gamma [Marinimicrobium koreense]|tara:strand:- start:271 stop:639 length:369 start_codon:yes stop_codon:yes gene_type:complete